MGGDDDAMQVDDDGTAFFNFTASGYVLCVYYCNIPFKFLQIRTQIFSMQLMHNLGFVKTCELHCKSFLESFFVVNLSSW